MDSVLFERCLGQYPIVRKSNYCRISWNTQKSEGDEKSLEQPLEKKMKVDQDLEFSPALEMYLSSYFGKHDVQQIKLAFTKAQSNYGAQLCLDDVEEICSQLN